MPNYAPYGNAIYGLTVYGYPPPIHVQTNMSVGPTPTNATPTVGLYNSLFVSWILPGGNWNQLVLVRSSFGVPISPFASDGVQLLNQTSNFNTSFTDVDLAPGRFYYYSLFVFDTDINEWLPAASAQGLCLSDYAFPEQFTSWTPDWYMEQDAKLVPASPLQRFFDLIGFEMNWIRSEIETLYTLNSPEYISGAMLPFLGGNVGIGYEPALGMTQSRDLVSNAVQLYKTKGTFSGVQAAASLYTGYSCVLTLSQNQEIQLDDSAFDRSIGHWKAQNAFTSLSLISAASAGVTPQHVSYLPIQGNTGLSTGLLTQANAKGYLPSNSENFLEVSANGGPAVISTCTAANATTLGIPIPVSNSQVVVLSGYVRPVTATTHSWFAQLDWYGQTGNLISSSAGVPITEIASTWVRAFVAATPPLGAAYYGRTFQSVGSLTGDTHLFDAVQTEVNTQATPGPSGWVPPRDLQLNLLPTARNLAINGQGLAGTYGWSGVNTTNVVAVSSAGGVSWPVSGMTGGYELTASTSSFNSVQITNRPLPISVTVGVEYCFSAYMMPVSGFAVSANDLFVLTIDWVDQFNVTRAVLTETVPVAPFGTFTFLTTVVGTAPLLPATPIVGAVMALQYVHSTNIPIGTPVCYAAAPTASVGSVLPQFFDGTFSPSPDYAFEGTPNESISDYYPNVASRLSRLITAMPEYIPIGSTFSIFTHNVGITNAGLR